MRSRALPSRGDLWKVAFGRPVGHEQSVGTRPALVISSDQLNSARNVVIVVPITSVQRDYPSRLPIQTGPSGLRQTSWAAVDHLRSVSVLRLEEYVGSVGPEVLVEVERVLDLLLWDRV